MAGWLVTALDNSINHSENSQLHAEKTFLLSTYSLIPYTSSLLFKKNCGNFTFINKFKRSDFTLYAVKKKKHVRNRFYTNKKPSRSKRVLRNTSCCNHSYMTLSKHQLTIPVKYVRLFSFLITSNPFVKPHSCDIIFINDQTSLIINTIIRT